MEDRKKIEHPSHYNQNGIECFDVIEAALGTDGLMNFCHGNAIKYLFRACHKDDYYEDIEKAAFYCNKVLELKGGEE